LRPIDILTGEIAIEVTGVVGVSPALWYFKYIASIFLTLHKRLWLSLENIRRHGATPRFCPSFYMYEVSYEEKSCINFLNQYYFICRNFFKLYKYNINISQNKTTGLGNNFNNLNVNNNFAILFQANNKLITNIIAHIKM
jgi:hypothetical protein